MSDLARARLANRYLADRNSKLILERDALAAQVRLLQHRLRAHPTTTGDQPRTPPPPPPPRLTHLDRVSRHLAGHPHSTIAEIASATALSPVSVANVIAKHRGKFCGRLAPERKSPGARGATPCAYVLATAISPKGTEDPT